jgi:Flp pilus assembly protein TadG
MSGLCSRGPRAGTVAVEFALVGSALFLICFGVLDLGILLWTQEALQSAAAQTARCAALGASTCTNPQQFAVNIVSAQTFAGVVTTGNVWVQSNATCTSTQGAVTAGKYTVVRISSSFWASGLLPPPLNLMTLKASACYPNAV